MVVDVMWLKRNLKMLLGHNDESSCDSSCFCRQRSVSLGSVIKIIVTNEGLEFQRLMVGS